VEKSLKMMKLCILTHKTYKLNNYWKIMSLTDKFKDEKFTKKEFKAIKVRVLRAMNYKQYFPIDLPDTSYDITDIANLFKNTDIPEAIIENEILKIKPEQKPIEEVKSERTNLLKRRKRAVILAVAGFLTSLFCNLVYKDFEEKAYAYYPLIKQNISLTREAIEKSDYDYARELTDKTIRLSEKFSMETSELAIFVPNRVTSLIYENNSIRKALDTLY
jgi:hypothetical protein